MVINSLGYISFSFEYGVDNEVNKIEIDALSNWLI